MTLKILINSSYFIVALLFILGLKGMSSPVTARRGILWAGAGMVMATLVTFGSPGMANYTLMVIALAIGGGLSWWSGKRVRMTDMPQMVALYNGMGGGAAAAIAAIELARGETSGSAVSAIAGMGGLIGTVSFSGSLVAFAKLQGIMRKTFHLPAQNAVNAVLAGLTFFAGIHLIILGHAATLQILAFFVLALALGAIFSMPIGGADMPVVISLFNALTGLAVGFEGYVLNNPALIIAGIVVGSAGTLLTKLMARAMNRPLTNILFKPITGEAGTGGVGISGTLKEVSALDAASMLRYAQKVIIVPGYGMAVSQAQHKIKEMSALLEEAGVEVKFAIHPVAGRMPGHMNVLLAEANVPYEQLKEMDEVNDEFKNADVALIVGANDVVNPSARNAPGSPIYGMPILNADQAKNVIFMKRSMRPGFAGIDNDLMFGPNTVMFFGDAKDSLTKLVAAVKAA